MKAFLNDLLRHSEWADSLYFRAWGQSPAREHDELRSRIEHILSVQRAFRSMLSGGPPIWPDQGPPPGHEDQKRRSQEWHASLQAFLAGQDEDSLAKKVHISFFPDPPCYISVAEGLVQVAMHGQHHRGQCMTRLKDFGGKPVNVDWIIWLWKARPAPEWS